MDRICSKCGLLKEKADFYASNKNTCKVCCVRCKREWRKTPAGRAGRRKEHNKYRQNMKQKVLSVYCNGKIKCNRCGYGDIRALSLDHINNDGAEHRRKLGIGRSGGRGMYEWVLSHRPPDLQVLCMNCQWIKRDELYHPL